MIFRDLSNEITIQRVNYEFIISHEDNIIVLARLGITVVGATVVGTTVVGATVVGATVVGTTVVGITVVGATEFPSIQSTYVFTLVYTPGRSGRAQPIPQDTTPASWLLQIKGPPLSP